MNPTDEARLDWSEDGPDEGDVLADNDRLAAENERLRAQLGRVEHCETCVHQGNGLCRGAGR